MTDEEIEMLLRSIDPHKESTADGAIDAALQDVRAAPRRVLELWQEPFIGLSARAEQLLPLLEEAAVGVSQEAVSNTRSRQQLVSWFIAGYGKVYNQACERLIAAFPDKRLIPLKPDRGPVEEENPPGRVCDEAYLNLRLLANLSESAATAQITRNEFLSRPDEEKDREIEEFQTLGKWNALVEEVEDDIAEGQ